MIIFLFGEDGWRRGQRKNFIVSEFLKKNPSWGFSVFDMESDEGEKSVNDFMGQTSLFGGKKLAVLENLDPKEHKKFLVSYLKSDNAILVSVENKPTKEIKFLLEDPVIKEEFPILRGADWVSFLGKKAKEFGLALSPDALRFFASVYEKDTWSAITELQRLSFLSKKELSVKDLSNFGLETSPDFWLTLRRFTGRVIKDRLWALQMLNFENEPAGKTFNILSSFWGEMTGRFAEYDIKVKSGKLEYEEALLDAALI